MPTDAPNVCAVAVIDEPELIIVLVVDDSEDDELVHAIEQDGQEVPAERFGGAWSAQIEADNDGDSRIRSVRFHLIQRGGGMERAWQWPSPDAEVLRLLASTPHLVALLPSELAPDTGAAGTTTMARVGDIVPRLGGSMLVEVATRSDSIAAAME